MKPYALKNFSERYIKDKNINDVGCYVWTPYLNIKSEYRDDFEIYDDEEYASVSVPYTDIDELLDDPFNYEWCMSSDFDEYEYEDFISELIKKAEHYLVCAYACTWDRRTGYKIVDKLKDAFYRNYDCHQCYNGGSQGGKSICITEYSHDAPMGYRTMIIGLTNKEYERLSYWNVDFNTVIKFADEHSKKIIEI